MTRPVLTPLDGDGIIDTAELVDLAVTAAKLAADAVETTKILNAAVTTAKILDDAVTEAKIPKPTLGSLSSDSIRYAKLGHIVHIWTTTTWNGGTTTLPSGFRPAHDTSTPGVQASDSSVRIVTIRASDGAIVISASGNVSFTASYLVA